MSSPPSPPPLGVTASRLSVVLGGKSSGSSDHPDSGIDNCNGSDTSNCHTTHADLTTGSTCTRQELEDDFTCSSSSDGDHSNRLGDDYEIVQASEQVKVNTRPKAKLSSAESKRQDVGNSKVATSKEEKQRTNEIIILESSSVSSETGSWESVSPLQLQLQQQQQPQTMNYPAPVAVPLVITLSGVADGKETDGLCPVPNRTACFIDASSLFDESELIAAQGTSSAPLPPLMDQFNARGVVVAESNKVTDPPVVLDIKDQFSSGDYTPLQLSGGELVSSRNSDGGEEGTCRSVSSPPKDKQDSEKLLGSIVFKNSINEYSGVVIDTPEPYNRLDGSDLGVDKESTGGREEECKSGYPLRNARSDFTSLMDIYQENKRNGSSGSGYKFNYMRTQSENHAQPQSIILPDTPHNSIMNVNVLTKVPSEDSESDRADEDRTRRRHLKFETAPIVSGGVSVMDFSPKLCESPPVRRKLDTCPILSGGFVSQEQVSQPLKEVNSISKPTESTSFKSWVIDLNDLSPAKEEEPKRIPQSAPMQKFSHFYVSLDNTSTEKDNNLVTNSRAGTKECASLTSSVKKSTGFFVDLTEETKAGEKDQRQSTEKAHPELVATSSSESGDDKKNMFSMFIDFGEKKPVPKKESLSFTSRLSDTINRRKELERRSESPRRTTERVGEVEKCTSLPFVPLNRMNDEVQLRPKFRSSVSEDHRQTCVAANSETVASTSTSTVERPISFTAGDKSLMRIIDKIPLLSKTSSMSIDSSVSPLEDFTCSKSELSTLSTSGRSNSNNSSTKDLNKYSGSAKIGAKRHQKDVNINETYDKSSSQNSLTDGALSKDLSPDSATATNTDELTYQNDPPANVITAADELSAEATIRTDAGLSTIIEANERLSSPAKKEKESKHTMETLQATIEKQRKLLETVSETAETTSFVRLSDMDKPFQSFEICSGGGTTSSILSKSGGVERRTARPSVGGNYYEKTRHTNMYYSTDTNMINLASSFENSQSLSRIFPHLSKVFSNSLPANVGLEISSSMPWEMASMSSGLSPNSSVTSSCNPSAQDSGDDSSIFCRQPKRLGEDLLKMFLHEIGTDVTIDIGGQRQLKAHKCILQSRCQYFAAILAGGWVSRAGNQISLPGYSYEAIHFALCHIYSGASHPPEGISLMELAAIADLLGLVGLREVTEHALKVNYCHNFHKPCLGCIEGILQVLPVALNHGLDDLYRKCLKWTCKHYLKIWPTRTFASLSSDLKHRCQQQIIAHLSAENVLTRILECENLLAVVAPLRWGASVEIILHEISDTAQIYLSEHFASLIASDSFLSLGHDQSCNIPALENLLLRAASTLSPDQACRSYQRVTKLHQVLHSKILTQQQNKIRALIDEDVDEELDWDVEFIRLVGGLLSAVEQCLQRQCSRAMRTNAWQRLDLELRKKIQKLVSLTDPLFERRQRPTGRQQQKTPAYQATFNRNQDIQQVRQAIHAHSKRSAQGYIIDQFTNNNQSHNNHINNALKGRAGGGYNLNKSQSTTHTQTNNHDGRVNLQKGKRDKSVQANQDSSSTNKISSYTSQAAGGPLEKSKSQGFVHNNRVSRWNNQPTTALQRNASTSQVPANRGRTEVKSRYMDISSSKHRAVQPMNEAVRHVKQKDQFSSSGTSTRTASPLSNRRATTAAAVPKHLDSQMSLDSLASPKKQLTQTRGTLPVHHDDYTLSRDSLAESMRSSVRTNGTVSQESLHPDGRNNKLKATNQGTTKNVKTHLQKSMNGGSTSGSTSSVGTNAQNKRGGGLMRNFSDSGVEIRNPRTVSRGLSSNSNSSNASTRTSFLSKKSREILERRSLIDEQKSVNYKAGPEDVRRSLPINKSSSASNIPTKHRIFATTLHLRKTAAISEQQPKGNGIDSSKRASNGGLKPSRIAQKVGVKNDRSRTNLEKSEKDLICTEKAFEGMRLEDKDLVNGFESKMVRSSTFSKDCPDLSESIEIG